MTQQLQALLYRIFLKFSFFPAVEDDLAIATIEYPSGTPLEITEEGFKYLEQAASLLEKDLEQEFPGQKIIKNRLSSSISRY